MDPEITDQIFDELFPVFQSLETQNAAILQLLKDKRIVDDGELAPYLEEAGKSSSVRWQVARIRVAKLLGTSEKKAEMQVDTSAKASENRIYEDRAAERATRASKETSTDSAGNKSSENNVQESNEARSEDRLSIDKEQKKDRDLETKRDQASPSGREKTKQGKTRSETAGEEHGEPDHAPPKAEANSSAKPETSREPKSA